MEIDYDILEEEEDFCDVLVEKLMEYKWFKEVVKELKEKEVEWSFYFSKFLMDLVEYDDGIKVVELDVLLNDMLSVFNKMLCWKKLNKFFYIRIII